jgi:hypothetical protein
MVAQLVEALRYKPRKSFRPHYVLGLTQPLTVMSTGGNSWGLLTVGATCMCQLSRNSGSLRACTGIVLPSSYTVRPHQQSCLKMKYSVILCTLPYLRLLSAVVAVLWPLSFIWIVCLKIIMLSTVQVINVLVNLLQPNVLLFNFSG